MRYNILGSGSGVFAKVFLNELAYNFRKPKFWMDKVSSSFVRSLEIWVQIVRIRMWVCTQSWISFRRPFRIGSQNSELYLIGFLFYCYSWHLFKLRFLLQSRFQSHRRWLEPLSARGRIRQTDPFGGFGMENFLRKHRLFGNWME